MSHSIKYPVIFLLLVAQTFLYSQENSLDSLKRVLSDLTKTGQSLSTDTAKLSVLVELSEVCGLHEILNYAVPAAELSDKLLLDKKAARFKSKLLNQKATALNNIGFVYTNRGDLYPALGYYNKSLKIYEQTDDKTGIANALNNIGVIYDNQGDIPLALDYYNKSLKIQEETGDKNGIAFSLNNIGTIYDNQNDTAAALQYYNRSLKIRREIADKEGIANSLNNIGGIYDKKGDIASALIYYLKSLNIYEETNDKFGVSRTLSNIGFIHRKQKNISKALDYFSKSLKLNKELEDKSGVAFAYCNIGGSYAGEKKYFLAERYLDSALALSKSLGFPEIIRNAERLLSTMDASRGNYTGAFEHYKQFIIYRDSLDNEASRKAGIKNKLKYEFGKKEAVIKEQQEKERALAEEKNHFQQTVIFFVVCGLLLVTLFSGFVLKTLKKTRVQKLVIEEKQKEIIDSIRYAKRIQQTLLPGEKFINTTLNRLLNNE